MDDGKGEEKKEEKKDEPKRAAYKKPVKGSSGGRKFQSENIKAANAKSARPKRTKGRTQAIMDILRKNAEKYGESADSIKKFLDFRESIRVSDEDATFYSKLLLLSYNNVRLNITDVLGPRQFNLLYRSPNFSLFPLKQCIFTNDKLYWIARIFIIYKDEARFRQIFVDDDIYIMLCSSSIFISNSENYRKGFIQDYNKKFSYIGKDTFTQFDINSTDVLNAFASPGLLSAGYKEKYGSPESSVVTFNFNNVEYTGWIMTNGAFICYVKDTSTEDVKKMMNKEQLIEDKKNSKDNLKIIEVSKKYDGINAFISQKIKLSDFVPGILEFPKQVDYSFFAYIPISMSALDELVGENIEKNPETINALFESKEIVLLNNFDLFMHYLNFLLYTRFKITDKGTKVKKKIEDAISVYNSNYRLDMVEIKKKFSDAQAFLLKFYDSFYNKINVDVCLNLSRTYDSKIRDVCIYLADHVVYLENISTDFITAYGMDVVCGDIKRKFMNAGAIANALNTSRTALEDIRLGQYTELETNVRAAGKTIYDLMNASVFDEFRSPNLFLGDVEYLDDALGALMASEIKAKEKAKKIESIDVAKAGIANDIAMKIGLAHILAVITSKDGLYNRELKTVDKSIDELMTTFGKSIEPIKDYLIAGGKNLIVEGKDEILVKVKDNDPTFFKGLAEEFLKIYNKLHGEKKPEIKRGDSILKEGSDFSADTTIISMSNVGPKLNTPNSKATSLGISEVVTEQLLKNMGIRTYQQIIGQDVNKNTLKAWRDRGITDDVLYSFYDDILNKPKDLKIPTFKDYFQYTRSMQAVTQSKYGTGVKGDLAIGGSRESTMPVDDGTK